MPVLVLYGRMYARPRPSTADGSKPSALHFMTQLQRLAGSHWPSFGVVLMADSESWKRRSLLISFGMIAAIRGHALSSIAAIPFELPAVFTACTCAAFVANSPIARLPSSL